MTFAATRMASATTTRIFRSGRFAGHIYGQSSTSVFTVCSGLTLAAFCPAPATSVIGAPQAGFCGDKARASTFGQPFEQGTKGAGRHPPPR